MKTFSILSILLLSLIGNASPYKYTKCNHDIISPSSSAGFLFSKDCSTAYVLPPKTGMISLTGYSPALSDSQCEITKAKMDVVGDLTKYSRDLSKKLIKNQTRNQSLNLKLMDLRLQCETVNTPLTTLKSQRDSYQSQVDTLSTTNSSLLEKIKQCSTEGKSCREEKRSLNYNKKLVKKYKKFISKVGPKISKLEARYSSCVTTVNSRSTGIQAQIKNLEKTIEDMGKLIDAYVQDFRAEVTTLQEIPGASLQLSFEINHNELVNEFKNKNKHLESKIYFEAMPTKEMSINFSAILDGIEARVPAVLQSDIPGLESIQITGDQTQMSVEPTKVKSVMMGQSLNGGVVINQLAACNYQNTKKPANFSALLVANVNYTYDVMAERKYKVDYIESHLYEMIKKSSTSGGFFRTSASTSITEKAISKQWIDILIMNNDSGFDFSDREKMAADLRDEYLNRALMNVTLGFLQEGHPSLPTPSSQNGAGSASSAIKKCMNVYCQAAGLILDVANSVFGGSNSSASQRKFASAERGSSLEEHKAIPQSGSLNFIMEN